jgi:hypothetical protein
MGRPPPDMDVGGQFLDEAPPRSLAGSRTAGSLDCARGAVAMNGLDPAAPSGDLIAAEHKAASTTAADNAIEFLKLLRPSGPWQLSAINPYVNNDINTVTATTSDQAREFINRYNGSHNLLRTQSSPG